MLLDIQDIYPPYADDEPYQAIHIQKIYFHQILELDENSSIYSCNYLSKNVINCSEPMGYFSNDDDNDAWDGKLVILKI